MPAPRNRRHLILPVPPSSSAYSPHTVPVDEKIAPAPESREAHGRGLRGDLEAAIAEAASRRAAYAVSIPGATPGLYVEFESAPGTGLALKSLGAGSGVELVAVTYSGDGETSRVEHATVFISDGQVGRFLSRLDRYANDVPKSAREVRHERLFDPIAKLRLATLRALYTDDPDDYPDPAQPITWEVWLRVHDGGELERLRSFAAYTEIVVSNEKLRFGDRIVTLVRASASQLASSIDVLDDLAELRRAKELARSFTSMDADEQATWVEDLRARTTAPSQDAPAVCVFDTGVTRGHPLLSDALAPEDCHTCEPKWGTHDHHGHGTEMAGLALYGDLTPVLASKAPVTLRHRLESVKVLPQESYEQNDPKLYGAVTADAVGRVEIEAPTRRRVFSMSFAARDQRDRGQPTSWSAAIDALAAGRSFDSTSGGLEYFEDGGVPAVRRLFVVNAGNVEPYDVRFAHLEQSDFDVIHDPGQAWNALTVGAFTAKSFVGDPSRPGWQALARPGELSPWSTTSLAFAPQWPIKPDVVFEGGNVAANAMEEVDFPLPDLSLLTTRGIPTEGAFKATWATSAATAQAARMAAIIAAEYPALGPETIRALIVHAAEWTPQMRRALEGAGSKQQRARLVRRYGFGVPSLRRALRSASDSLTLIAEGVFHPFANGKMREIHFFELPWPQEALLALGAQSVRLRITLSYFVEPNPGRRGWRQRHRYASHGLQFELKTATESLTEFRKRMNKGALEEEEERPKAAKSDGDWFLGSRERRRGSIHADLLEDVPAASLASSSVIAITPVSGWWKDLPARDRSEKGAPYALVVSIDAPDVETDIWTPVAKAIEALVSLPTEIQRS